MNCELLGTGRDEEEIAVRVGKIIIEQRRINYGIHSSL